MKTYVHTLYIGVIINENAILDIDDSRVEIILVYVLHNLCSWCDVFLPLPPPLHSLSLSLSDFHCSPGVPPYVQGRRQHHRRHPPPSPSPGVIHMGCAIDEYQAGQRMRRTTPL